MEIRPAEPTEYRAIAELIRSAFWNVYRPGADEHLAMEQMRESNRFVPELDLVMFHGDQLVGQIAYIKGSLETDQGSEDLIMFGPVAILPELQGKGLGSHLIRYSLAQAKKLGFHAVVIMGNPNYYHRFGFENASDYGICLPNASENDPAEYFMVNRLMDGPLRPGIFHEPIAYQVNPQDLEEFEKSFPYLEKKKLPSQIFE